MRAVKLFSVILFFLIAFGLAGCAAPTITPSSLRKATENKEIVFNQDVLFYASSGQDAKPPEERYVQGLLTGKYSAEYEDEKGIYYRGKGPCVIWASDPKRKTLYFAEGGVWIEKTSNHPKFRLYKYMLLDTERTVSAPNAFNTNVLQINQFPGTNSDTALIPILVNATPSGASIMQAGIGAGISVGIVQAIIDSDKGKIRFVSAPRDEVSIVGRFITR